MTDRINDDAIIDALAGFVKQHFPFAFCYACLARRLDASEFALRAASQRLLVRSGWSIERRYCHGCARQDLVLERCEPAIILAAHAPVVSDARCIM